MSATPRTKMLPRQVRLRLLELGTAYDDAISEDDLGAEVPFSRLCALFIGPRRMR